MGRLEEELIRLADASGLTAKALQVGELPPARREWLLGRGGASGAAAVPGLAHSCGCVGRFVWCVLSYHISLPNLYDSQTKLGRGLGQRDS